MEYLDPRETYFHKILNLNEDSPYYYVHLISYAKLLLKPDTFAEIQKMIDDIELVVGADIRAILVAINNNLNMNAFFKEFVTMEDGSIHEFRLTRYEIVSKLEEIRKLIFEKMKELQYTIRFTKITTIQPS